jgi:hypothetical protein
MASHNPLQQQWQQPSQALGVWQHQQLQEMQHEQQHSLRYTSAVHENAENVKYMTAKLFTDTFQALFRNNP